MRALEEIEQGLGGGAHSMQPASPDHGASGETRVNALHVFDRVANELAHALLVSLKVVAILYLCAREN